MNQVHHLATGTGLRFETMEHGGEYPETQCRLQRK
jgi:hypothetical protein